MERVQDEGRKTEQVEMPGLRRCPTAKKDKRPNPEIKQPHDLEISSNGPRVSLGSGLGSDDNCRLKRLAMAVQMVRCLSPCGGAENRADSIHRTPDALSVNRLQPVAFANARAVSWTAGRNNPGLDSLGRIQPRDTIRGRVVSSLLLEIHGPEHQQRQAQHREQARRDPSRRHAGNSRDNSISRTIKHIGCHNGIPDEDISLCRIATYTNDSHSMRALYLIWNMAYRFA